MQHAYVRTCLRAKVHIRMCAHLHADAEHTPTFVPPPQNSHTRSGVHTRTLIDSPYARPAGADRVEKLLALGATRWEATRAPVTRAVRLAMTPLLNQMSVVGLVSIPGGRRARWSTEGRERSPCMAGPGGRGCAAAVPVPLPNSGHWLLMPAQE